MVPTWQVFWHDSGSNYPENVLSKKFSKKFYKIPWKTSMTKFRFNSKETKPTDTKLYLYKEKPYFQ